MVNIDGTKTLLEVCKEEKVKSFIYTSSASVVYSGAPLVNVDETIPYPQKFADYYSETKAIAEKMCLAANSPSGMKTLAIRPSGIFGPGDAQTTPGALIAQKKNFPVLLQVGNNTALFDFTYVDNIVDAHISASDLLSSSHNTQIQGQAFFITNGQPIGMWSFLRLIWAQVGDTRKPLIIIPNIIATFILYFLKLLACIGVVKHEVPFVFGMTFTSRYFNITKAKTLLNYSPRISYAQGVPIAVKSCLERWKSQDPGSSDKKTN
ncbi:Sterol-4-alpha-carboxylate 3-dehydrogenase, decarboxylating [Zancudomyces culisetae]|uniref:Sterol-4-alpha-carboxylate 3-dehydrogenase, decarboxylating n=1 Tax=Zancudomyces culisetae TaxID=1213189 RepID=A0A1R1PGJ7_ZANCU|nr:Sterol-4-alpha-carboxylate 3-dehydrogenase, decarboxylating [Zancudomyces culisetae]OMH80261.1 Sterol-4-alpha-carboxylate 3-dehydrogenase, decarboxylating [Zancudomyces culisetae]|eukprot:OMH80058.1 Sterol-4-alpha-carboxylate 3-dehydrogenase, decarboxylating [Zancudomyces culisetae]